MTAIRRRYTIYPYNGYSKLDINMIRQTLKIQDRLKKNTGPLTSNLTLEQRLQVIANLIVDRIIEDQLNGALKFKTKQNQ